MRHSEDERKFPFSLFLRRTSQPGKVLHNFLLKTPGRPQNLAFRHGRVCKRGLLFLWHQRKSEYSRERTRIGRKAANDAGKFKERKVIFRVNLATGSLGSGERETDWGILMGFALRWPLAPWTLVWRFYVWRDPTQSSKNDTKSATLLSFFKAPLQPRVHFRFPARAPSV